MPKRTLFTASIPLLLLGMCSASAQLTISGVVDKATYADRVAFTVAAEPGFGYEARLDGQPVPVGTAVTVGQVDYHQLWVYRTNLATLDVTNRLIRFIVYSGGRTGTENGLRPWTPLPDIPSAGGEFAGAQLALMAPAKFPAGYPIPVVAWVQDGQGRPIRVNGTLSAPGRPGIRVLRGVGSGFLKPENEGTVEYSPSIGSLVAGTQITVEPNTSWLNVSGALAPGTTWPAGSRIHVTGHLTNVAGSTLTIGAGCIIRVGAGVDIYNHGQIVVLGSTADPVVFMPAVPGQLWGGFIQHASNAGLNATGTIFTGSGANQGCWFTGHGCSSSVSGISSHRSEQALISLKGANCNLSLTDSAAISLGGQFGHSAGGVGGSYRIVLSRFLMQRCTTGGEYTDASIAMNDSALIECPADTPEYADGDNDAIYIINGTHGFTNTLFGWTKDDGVDSGGNGSGVLNFSQCWFESTFHEGNSLSGTGKQVTHFGSVFMNCGQALEAGYDGPTGTLAGCLSTANLVGARFGDNYDWTYNGFLRVTNSILIHNDRDVWGMNWADWTYRTNQMNIRDNLLTQPDPIWPVNEVWDPTADGTRLAPFITGPADSAVGAGLALRTNRLDPATLTNGIPVRLSRFSPNPVRVGYRAETGSGPVESGTLEFQPGETVKILRITAPSAQSAELLRVGLSQPLNAEITGSNQAFMLTTPTNVPQGTVLIAPGARWHFNDTGTNLGTAWVLPSFVETNWSAGDTQLGFGDQDENGTVRSNRQVTTYFRHVFSVADPATFQSLTLGLLRDDGGIVYLNGTEVFRSNLPQGPIDYLTLATNALPQDETTFFYTNAVSPAVLHPGDNLAAVEIHQSSATSSDLSFDLVLVGNPRPTAPVLRQATVGGQFLLYWHGEGALEESVDLAGPWKEALPGNPLPVALSGDRRFFRLKQ